MSLKFSEINEGDVLCEEGYGSRMWIEVTTQPVKSYNDGCEQWSFNCKILDPGVTKVTKDFEYLQIKGLEHLGPTLYRVPHFWYGRKDDGGNYVG